MQRKKPHTCFWTVLATTNVLALIYPMDLLHDAKSGDESLFGAILLIGLVFLLLVVDAVSILSADLIGNSKP
jgi:hypothetical protein